MLCQAPGRWESLLTAPVITGAWLWTRNMRALGGLRGLGTAGELAEATFQQQGCSGWFHRKAGGGASSCLTHVCAAMASAGLPSNGPSAPPPPGQLPVQSGQHQSRAFGRSGPYQVSDGRHECGMALHEEVGPPSARGVQVSMAAVPYQGPACGTDGNSITVFSHC